MISITLWPAEIGQSSSSYISPFSCQIHILMSILIFLLELLTSDNDKGIQTLIIIHNKILYFIFGKSFDLNYFLHNHIGIHILNEQFYIYQVYIFLSIILLQSGDIEPHPGPISNTNQRLSVFFWNLNSLSVNNFVKKDLMIAFNSIHNFDIICLAETYLDSSYTPDDKDLQIDSYTMIRADHPMDI